jgi:hypothetical protein
MAIQVSRTPQGENVADATLASRRAVGETYKSPKPFGAQLAGQSAGRGQNQYRGPSSVSVKDAALSNPDFSPPDGVRDSIIQQGFGGPHSDQLRTISEKNVPTHPAMQRRDVSSGSPGGNVPGSLSPVTENPVRQPK